MIVERSEYKGKPVMILKRTDDDKFPFTFGLTKARIIVEAIESIREFVAENEREA